MNNNLKGLKWVGDLSLADAGLLAHYSKKSRRILEFGVGGSTQIIAQCKPEYFLSVDTDVAWIERTKANLYEIEDRVDVVFSEYNEFKKSMKYSIPLFDMIFVDGDDPLRLEFALMTWRLLSVNGVMIFHDTRRLRDVNNVVDTVIQNFSEVSLIEVNAKDSTGKTSNITVVHKKNSETYENWNYAEGKPLSAYHQFMAQTKEPLWEYPGTANQEAFYPKQLAVYTTFCGVSDKLTAVLEKVDNRYDHYFISNNREVLDKVQEYGWRPIFIDHEVTSDVKVSSLYAKTAKVLPHVIPELSGYDYLLYKDDKLKINYDLIPAAVDEMQKYNISHAVSKHPYHKDGNVLVEFGESMFQQRYSSDLLKISNYMTEELEAGFSYRKDTFYATGIILRNNKHPDTESINSLWYEHILRCGAECQISYHFVSQRYHSITTLPEGIRIW